MKRLPHKWRCCSLQRDTDKQINIISIYFTYCNLKFKSKKKKKTKNNKKQRKKVYPRAFIESSNHPLSLPDMPPKNIYIEHGVSKNSWGKFHKNLSKDFRDMKQKRNWWHKHSTFQRGLDLDLEPKRLAYAYCTSTPWASFVKDLQRVHMIWSKHDHVT